MGLRWTVGSVGWMAPIALGLACAPPSSDSPMDTSTSTTMGSSTSSQEGSTSSDEGLDSSGEHGSGSCGQTCTTAADCVPPGQDSTAYACTDGFCEHTAPCDPETCDDLGPGLACAEVDGFSQCTTPCSDDAMCIAGVSECTGLDDAGSSICALIPCGGAAEGAACETANGNVDVCTDGVCSCTDDAECTVTGQACNAG
jgi:hypothetical protein